MKRILVIVICILLPLISTTAAKHSRDSYRIRTVVIDAGHGGHDSGCLGSSAKEKHVALEIALKLGKLIEQNFPDVKVIYTRKTDVFIPLHERADIANRNHADLFICVHLNSGSKAAYGAETYVMGLHKSEDNLNVAKRENASILLEDDYKTQYDGFDPNSPEANIIFSLYQNQFMHQSLSFASKIQDQFEEYAGRNNRGVKQAGFLVLYKTAMPSVLIESGFLTHDMEEKYLDSDKGETTIATSIFRAFKEYKIDMETPGSVDKPDKTTGTPVQDKTEESKESTKTEEPQPVKETPTPVKKTDKVVKAEKEDKDDDDDDADSTDRTAPVKTPVKESKPTATVPPSVKTPVKENKPAENKPTVTPKAETATTGVFFTVQVGASTNPAKDNPKYLKNNGTKGIKCADGYTRYIVGNFTTAEAARQKQASVKAGGFKDAFITAFNGNERISIAEAEQMIKRP